MPLSILASTDTLFSNSSGTTTYIFPCGAGQVLTTEFTAQTKIPVAGTLKWAQVRLNGNAASGTNTTLTLRKNGVDTSLVVTITPAGGNSFANNTDSVQVAAGDLIAWKYITGSSGSSVALIGIYMWFVPDDPTVTLTCLGTSLLTTAPSRNTASDTYHTITGHLTAGEALTTVMNSRAVPILIDGTVDNFGMTSNVGGRSLTQRLIKNSVDDGIDRAVLAQDQNALVFSNGNPVSVVSTDKICYKLTTGATGTSRAWYYLWSWLKNLSKKSITGHYTQDGISPLSATATTTYYNVFGGSVSLSTFEPTMSWTVKSPMTLSKMTILVTTNALNAGQTVFRLRKNQANGNQVITVPAGDPLPSLYQDLVNTDSFVDGDTVSIQVDPQTATSGSIAWVGIMFEMTDNLNYVLSMTNNVEKNITNKFVTKQV